MGQDLLVKTITNTEDRMLIALDLNNGRVAIEEWKHQSIQSVHLSREELKEVSTLFLFPAPKPSDPNHWPDWGWLAYVVGVVIIAFFVCAVSFGWLG